MTDRSEVKPFFLDFSVPLLATRRTEGECSKRATGVRSMRGITGENVVGPEVSASVRRSPPNRTACPKNAVFAAVSGGFVSSSACVLMCSD